MRAVMDPSAKIVSPRRSVRLTMPRNADPTYGLIAWRCFKSRASSVYDPSKFTSVMSASLPGARRPLCAIRNRCAGVAAVSVAIRSRGNSAAEISPLQKHGQG